MRTTLWLLLAVLLLAAGCSVAQARAAGVTTAQLANEVARAGDRIAVVSAEECHAAELRAAKLPDLVEARATVGLVRTRCDAAFLAVAHARDALAVVDDALSRSLTARDLAALVLTAREAVEAAQALHVELARWLQGVAR